ncbi:MAG: MFS transporter, partial [Pseudomonadota bacterium]
MGNDSSLSNKEIWFGWRSWIVLALFYAYEFTQRVSPAVMIPEMMADLGVTAAAIGSLSAYYYYFYALMQIPAGFLYDRFNPRKVILVASLLVALGSFLLGHAHTLILAQAARAIIGVGSAFAFVGCIKLGMSWLPFHQIPMMIGLTNLFGVFGAILGGAPLAALLKTTHWHTIFSYGALVGLALTLLIYQFVILGPRLPLHTTAERKPLKQILIQVCGCRQTWLNAFYGALLVAPIAGFAELWGTPYLMLAYDITRPMAALLVSLIFCGIAIGGPTMGYLSQRYNAVQLM